MNARLLIHAVVRQTTVLIATLATSSGQRAQLAAVANAVFGDLVRELREQGLGNKVIADMFGMALRTYHRKVARMSGSRTLQGRSLWEAVLGHIQQHGPLTRSELALRFARDDEATLHSVVADLISSGLVGCEGDGDTARLQALRVEPESGSGGLDALVLVTLHRAGPLTAAGLAQFVPAPTEALDAALQRLIAERLVMQHGDAYGCETCVIQFGEAAGWEAAVLDRCSGSACCFVGASSISGTTGVSFSGLTFWEVGGRKYYFCVPQAVSVQAQFDEGKIVLCTSGAFEPVNPCSTPDNPRCSAAYCACDSERCDIGPSDTLAAQLTFASDGRTAAFELLNKAYMFNATLRRSSP
jgi:hypothetical protein